MRRILGSNALRMRATGGAGSPRRCWLLGALGVFALALPGCAGKLLNPTYTPAGLLQSRAAAATPISLRVVDNRLGKAKIGNREIVGEYGDIPLSVDSAREIVERAFAEALSSAGYRVEQSGPIALDVSLLRFQGELEMNVYSDSYAVCDVAFEVTVRRGRSVLVKRSIGDAVRERTAPWRALTGVSYLDVESALSQALSRATEKVLQDPAVVAALRGDAKSAIARAKRLPTPAVSVEPDRAPPRISVPESLETDRVTVEIAGRLRDASRIVELSVDGAPAPFNHDGSFRVRRAVPVGRTQVVIAAVDEWSNRAEQRIDVSRRVPNVSPVTTPAPPLPAVSAAPVGRRVALVIGNGAYRHTAPLPNPPNDARAVGAALDRLGFEVETVLDQDRNGMEQALRSFGDRLPGAKLALFYYAGHGLQVNGRNFLVPINAKLEKQRDLNYEVVSLDAVMLEMEAQERANLVILDACRDNPLARRLARSMGAGRSASVGRGLAITPQAAVGMLIAFSTAPGTVAADGVGEHSPYTRALLDWIERPGLEIGEVFRHVRKDVLTATGRSQVPWENSSLVGEGIYLAAGR